MVHMDIWMPYLEHMFLRRKKNKFDVQLNSNVDLKLATQMLKLLQI